MRQRGGTKTRDAKKNAAAADQADRPPPGAVGAITRSTLPRIRQWLERGWPLPVFLAACVYSLSCATIGWNLPILECHAFRQTQTAISTFYQVGGAPRLDYETPLFGPPWSIPMEFPTYQWLVAAVSSVCGTPLDQTGRALSLAMFWLMLIPTYRALGIFALSHEHRLVVLTLLVVSPFYTFWSRTFMIESTALAFSVAFLAASAAYLKSERRWQLALAIVCGILAALTKITTFSTFLGAFLLLMLWQRLQSPTDRAGWLRSAAIAAALVGPAILLGIAWTRYADAVKARNPLGAHLTSASLNAWNFGTLEQRLSPETWQSIADRLMDVESHASVYLLAIAALIVARRRWREAALCLALFVVAVLSFTNLHGHWYYAYANLIFLIAAVGLSIVGLLERGGGQRAAGMLLLALAVGVSAWRFQTLHARLQQNADPRIIHIAESVRRVTEPDEVIIVLGDDWSSRVPYYAQRRALMVADWAEAPQLSQALDNLARCRVGALVAFNKTGAADWPAKNPEIAVYLRRFGLSSVTSFSDQAARIFPTIDRAPPYEILGNVLRNRAGQSPDQMVGQLTKALESAPRECALYRARANGYLQQGNFAAALADCDRAAELGPREFEFQLDRAKLCVGIHEVGQGESSSNSPLLEQALASADRAVAMAPNQPAAYKIRGTVYAAMGRPDLAAIDAATAEDWLRPRPFLNGWGNLVIPQASPLGRNR